MQQSPPAEQRNEQHLTPRGRPYPKGVSGNPAGRTLGKRFIELFEAMAGELRDLGGELSAIETALLSQAVRLMVRSERTPDNDDAVRLANASSRLLSTLRNTKQRQHQPAPVESFASISARAQAAADVRRAACAGTGRRRDR
jgi:hypothetical protein